MSLAFLLRAIVFTTSVRVCTSSCAGEFPLYGYEIGSPKCMTRSLSGSRSGLHVHPTCVDQGTQYRSVNPESLVKWGSHMPPGCISTKHNIGCFGSTSPGFNVEVPANELGKFSEITDIEAWQNATAAAIKAKMGCDEEVYVSQPWEAKYGKDPETKDHIRALVVLSRDVCCCDEAVVACGSEPVVTTGCTTAGCWTAGPGMAFAVMVLIGLLNPAME